MTSRLPAWLWKEWREHRMVLACLAGAIPLFSALAFVALGEGLTFPAANAFPGVAVGLAFLAVGLDLFGGEVRRGTHALLLRTPGAFPVAFAGKFVFLLLCCAGAVALEEASRALLTAATGLPRTEAWVQDRTDMAGEPIRHLEPVLNSPWQGLPPALVGALAALAAGSFVVLASCAVPRAAVTAPVGVGSLALLAAPFAYFQYRAPWFYVVRRGDLVLGLIGVAVLGLLALALAYGRGRRFLGRTWAAALSGFGLAAAVAAGSYAAAGVAHVRWMDVRPDLPDFHIARGVVGSGGRYVYLNVHRGAEWSAEWNSVDRVADGTRDPGTPVLPWIVDLRDGSWRMAGDLGRVLQRPIRLTPQWHAGHAEPLAWVVCSWSPWFEPSWTETWIDARTGEARATYGPPKTPRHTQGWIRDNFRATSPVRDSSGRRVWIFEGRLEREGETLVDDPDAEWVPEQRFAFRPCPGGWIGTGNSFSSSAHFLDADTGETRTIAAPPMGFTNLRILGPLHYLRAERVPGTAKPAAWRWLLGEISSGRERAVGEDLPYGGFVGVVDREIALVRVPRGDDGDQFLLWEPATDRRTPVRFSVAPDRPVRRVYGWPEPRSDGTWLLELGDQWVPLSAPASRAWALIDPAHAEIRVLSPWSEGRYAPLAVDDDGSLVAIEDGKRVVRFGPEPEKRTVVFPRETAGN